MDDLADGVELRDDKFNLVNGSNEDDTNLVVVDGVELVLVVFDDDRVTAFETGRLDVIFGDVCGDGCIFEVARLVLLT